MILKDKIIIITGSSKGFGRALAIFFIKEGAKVILSSNNKSELKKSAQELSTDFFEADVTKPSDLDNLGKYVFDKYNSIDIWINNAGIQIAPQPVENVDPKDMRRLLEVNFFGYYYGCQTALRYMRKQGKGLIINVSSTAGLEGKPNLSVYCSTKFAVKGLTESIRQETLGTDIEVYEIYPGGMQTEIYYQKYPEDIKDYMQVDDVAQKVINNLKLSNPDKDFIIRRPKAIK